LNAAPETVWDAVRDFGAPHQRLTPGVLVDARLDQDGSRIVMFANGIVAREVLIDADEEARRVAYTVTGTFDHHSSSMQVVDSGAGAKLIWITDVLPNERAAMVSALKDQGIAAMKRVLERAAAA
jgi:hypothetical protein